MRGGHFNRWREDIRRILRLFARGCVPPHVPGRLILAMRKTCPRGRTTVGVNAISTRSSVLEGEPNLTHRSPVGHASTHIMLNKATPPWLRIQLKIRFAEGILSTRCRGIVKPSSGGGCSVRRLVTRCTRRLIRMSFKSNRVKRKKRERVFVFYGMNVWRNSGAEHTGEQVLR